MEDLIPELLNKNIIEKGEFILKSGEKSNTYVDLRKLISYPSLLTKICKKINQKINNSNKNYDHIIGVPTGGYSFAQTCSILLNKPCLFLRKEIKDHGKKKLLEGEWKKGDSVMLIEDVITSGTSLLETINKIQELGLNICGIVTVLNRSDIGISNVYTKTNIKVDYLFTLPELENYQAPCIPGSILTNNSQKNTKINLFGSALLDVIKHKKTNIILSLDLNNTYDILHLVETTGPHICGIKLHCDIIEDFSHLFQKKLKELAQNYNFIIIEDRKFADIGNTIEMQIINPKYNLANFVDAVTIHSISGPDILNVFKKHNLTCTSYSRNV